MTGPGDIDMRARRSSGVVVPSREDPVVAGAAELIGGPVGRRALVGSARYLTPLVVLVLLTVGTCFAGWVQKSPCRDPGKWQHNYQYTRLCYSDVEALYFSEGLSNGQHPYVDRDVEYPVVIGGLMQAGESVAHWFPSGQRATRFFDVTALMLTVAAVALVIVTAGAAGRRRPWDAALVALAPTLLFHAFTNWDLVAVAFASAGLYAWSRKRPGWAGFWLGLGVATKLYPLVFLVGLLALCWRAGKLGPWVRTAVTTIGTVVLVYVPVIVFTPVFADGPNGTRAVAAPSIWTTLHHSGGWSGVRRALAGVPILGASVPVGGCPAHNGLLRFFDLNRTRPADYDSVYYAFQDNVLHGRPIGGTTPTCGSPATLNTIVAVGVLLVLLLVVLLVVVAPRRPRVAQVLFLSLAGFVLVNKVYSPQYVLWLVPLAALARPKWGGFLAWQAGEVTLLLTRFMFFIGLGDARSGVGYRWFEAAVGVRDALLLLLMGLVVREVLVPASDVVRRTGEDDDPAGGLLDGAPDRHDPLLIGRPASVPAPG